MCFMSHPWVKHICLSQSKHTNRKLLLLKPHDDKIQDTIQNLRRGARMAAISWPRKQPIIITFIYFISFTLFLVNTLYYFETGSQKPLVVLN